MPYFGQVSTIQDALSTLCPEGPINSIYPLSMEEVKHVSMSNQILDYYQYLCHC